MESTPHTTLETETRMGEALSVQRLFTQPGVHPFEQVEWEIRDARIGHGDKVAFEQRDVEFPASWSQNATNIVAQKYFRGQLDSPERENSVRQMVGRVAGTISTWGREGGYFARSRTATLQAELTSSAPPAAEFKPGLVQRASRSSAVRHAYHLGRRTMESILDGTPRKATSSAAAPARASTSRTSAARWSRWARAAPPRRLLHARRRAWAGHDQAGGKTRRAARGRDRHRHRNREFIVQGQGRGKAAACATRSTCRSTERFTRSSTRTPTTRWPSDEFHARGGNDGEVAPDRPRHGQPVETIPARERSRDPEAAWRCADPGVRTTHVNHGTRRRIGADQRANRARSTCTSQLGLQPRVAEPHEVPPAGGTLDVKRFNHAVDIVSSRRRSSSARRATRRRRWGRTPARSAARDR